MRLKPRLPKSQRINMFGVVVGSLMFFGVLMLGGVGQNNTLSNILGVVALVFVIAMHALSWWFGRVEDDSLIIAEQRQKYNEYKKLGLPTFAQKRFMKNYLVNRENKILEKNQYISKAYLYNANELVNSVMFSTVPHEFSKSSHKLKKENVIVFTNTLLESFPTLFSFLNSQKQLLDNGTLTDFCIELVVFGDQSIGDADMSLAPETVEKAVVVRPQSLHVHYFVFSTSKQIEQFKQSLIRGVKSEDKELLFGVKK